MATESKQRGTSEVGERKSAARQREARKKRRIVIFAIEIIVILLMIVGRLEIIPFLAILNKELWKK